MKTPLLVALLFVCSVAAQAADVRRASGPIRIDAQLDEPAWQEATPIAVAHEWFPGDNTPAPVKTAALVTWDDRNLYVAFRAFDPQPARIRARYAERDAAADDDQVGFYIDPFNDDRRAYQFRINPLGVQRDAINSDVEGSEDFSWDGVWESAGRLTSDGYVVEVAIPLQQLRIPTGSTPQTWGFLAVREWPRDVKHRLRSVVTDQNRNCLVCQFGDVAGFQSVRAGHNAEVTPTLTGTAAQQRVGDGFQTVADSIEPGLSARWAMTPGTSLAATINPDFSHVEADAAQLDVNTRFATSFPEKRPFFLEGSDFFDTHMTLLFTRTIAEPEGGLKLTGKSGANSYGVLVARDEITNFLLPGDQSSRRIFVDEGSTTAVGRYSREFGKNANAGGFVASRTAGDYSNHVASADSYLRLTERDSLRMQAAGSRTEYPTGFAAFGQSTDALTGHALLLDYNHSDRNWSWEVEYEEYAPEFRADTGLFNQVGVRAGSFGAERRIRGSEKQWFRNIYVGASFDGTREWNDTWNEWGSDIYATYQGARQTTIELLLAPNQEYYRGRTYHNLRYNIAAQTQLTRDITIGAGWNAGEQIDFTNERPADFVTMSLGASINIGRRFRAGLDYDRQVFETEQGRRIFAVDLPQARLLYHFSRRAFVRTILQYRSLDREPAQYVVPVAARSRDLLTQLLFSYRIDAQTAVLAGYSDTYGGRTDLTQNARTVFVKLSYAWRF